MMKKQGLVQHNLISSIVDNKQDGFIWAQGQAVYYNYQDSPSWR